MRMSASACIQTTHHGPLVRRPLPDLFIRRFHGINVTDETPIELVEISAVIFFGFVVLSGFGEKERLHLPSAHCFKPGKIHYLATDRSYDPIQDDTASLTPIGRLSLSIGFLRRVLSNVRAASWQ